MRRWVRVGTRGGCGWRSAGVLLAGAWVAGAAPLEYAPAPVDNPLKGLVPYVSASRKDRFPHSMEFRYFPLKDFMKGPAKFDWAPIEKTLQDFVTCVERTHATWLMDTGLFEVRIPMDAERKATALKEVARLGYELHVSKAEWKGGDLTLTVENRGVAPFYYDWPVEFQQAVQDVSTTPRDWKLSEVLPGVPVTWKRKVGKSPVYRIRVPNPMRGGKPLRFANQAQGEKWLVVEVE